MEEKELNELLGKVDKQVSNKFNATVETFKEDFIGEQETKVNEAVAKAMKGLTGEIKEGEEAPTLAKLEKALVEQGKKLKEYNKAKEVKSGNVIKSMITDNFDQIKEVKKGNAINLKAVGNMTLPVNLTGDQPRDYNFDTVMVPGQLANVTDLVGTVNISGGTYTYPRETGSEGSISTQTEGSDKSQIDYDLTMVDVNTDFLAGYCVYSKKMRNNLPFLESFLPRALTRDYYIAENSLFNTTLSTDATASTVTSGNYIERLIAEISALESINHQVNGIVINPADYWTIMITEKSTGAGYGLPGVVTMDGGVLRINGIPVYKATWVASDKYYVADWSRINKVVTEGLGLEFSDEDSDNFRKNNITARIESQIALAVEQPTAIIYGDFTAVP